MRKAAGISDAGIAKALGIDKKTLRKHYKPELTHGHELITGRLAARLIGLADGGHFNALAFYLERKGGWHQPPTRIAGPDGGPIVTRSYVVRAPTAVESAAEWLSTYAPKENS